MQVSTECVSVYNELRLSRKYRYIVYSLNSDNTEIVVERKVERGAARSDAFKEFRDSLPTADYRFAVFDFQEQFDGNGSVELAQRVALPVDFNVKVGGMFLRVCDLFFGWRATVGRSERSLILGNPVRTEFRTD